MKDCSQYVTWILSQEWNFPLFPCWLFYFCTDVRHLREIYCHRLSLQQHFPFPFYFFCFIYISSRRTFICETHRKNMCIVARTYSCWNIIQCFFHLSCSMYSTCIYFPLLKYLLLWLYVPYFWHITLNWNTKNTFYLYFYYFWLDCALIRHHVWAAHVCR